MEAAQRVDGRRKTVLAIEDVGEWFGLEAKPELEERDTDYYFDRSAQIYYRCNDEEESAYLSCNLKQSDALMS